MAKNIVTTVLVSNVTYATYFFPLTKVHHLKLRSLWNDARRAILGLPQHTRLEELHNCIYLPEFKVLLRQQKEAHLPRLQHTKEERAIATYLDVPIQFVNPIPEPRPPWKLISLTPGAKPFPQNMNTKRDKETKKQQGKQHRQEIQELLKGENNIVVYTDGSTNPPTGTWVGATSIYHCSQRAPQANLVMPSPARRSGALLKKLNSTPFPLGCTAPRR